MGRYFNKQFAKKLLVIGGIVYAVSLMLNFVTVFKVYGKCLDKTVHCTFGAQQIIGKIAMIIGYAGILIFFIGLVLLLVMSAKRKKL